MKKGIALGIVLGLLVIVAPVIGEVYPGCCQENGFAHLVDGEERTYVIPVDTPLRLGLLDSGFETCYDGIPPSQGTLSFRETYCGVSYKRGTDHVYTPDPGFIGSDVIDYSGFADTETCGLCFGSPGKITIYVGCSPNDVPEFPTMVLPAVGIAGLLAAALCMQGRD